MIAMIAAIADKKKFSDRCSYGNHSPTIAAIIWKPNGPWISKVQISKHFLSIFNFIQVIELNNEYETTEIKLKPRRKFVAWNSRRKSAHNGIRVRESLSFLFLRQFVLSSLPSLISKAFLPSALWNQTSHFYSDLNEHLVNDFLSSWSINKLH